MCFFLTCDDVCEHRSLKVCGKGIEINGIFNIVLAFSNFFKECAVTVRLTLRRLTLV